MKYYYYIAINSKILIDNLYISFVKSDSEKLVFTKIG